MDICKGTCRRSCCPHVGREDYLHPCTSCGDPKTGAQPTGNIQNVIPVITPEEWNLISSQLEMHHALFYQMWQMGRPSFDTGISTAAVRFDDEGKCIEFVFNPAFWQGLTLEEKKFVICHESLHVIFNHGIRMADTKQRRVANVAMDIVVNHTLIDKFGFKRDDLSMHEKLCWLDTVFDEEAIKEVPIRENQAFEYYYLKLIENDGAAMKKGGVSESLDDHDGLEDIDPSEWDEIVDKLNESLSNEEKVAIRDVLEKHTEKDGDDKQGGRQAGTGSLGQWSFVNPGQVSKKKKWETVIKRWSKRYMKRDEDTVEQWARTARRLSFITGQGLFLPSEVDNDSWSQDRITVWFFQDVSGSCIGLKDRFFRAAKSLPKERFDVKMHTFDTRVFEIDINANRVRGGGGTSFTCMEQYIQRYIKANGEDYPKAVFVITDGFGNRVRPEKPENWYWFLSYNYRTCIPKESHVFMLNDYE